MGLKSMDLIFSYLGNEKLIWGGAYLECVDPISTFPAGQY